MDADYDKVKQDSEKLAKLITDAKEVIVKTSAGTNMKSSLASRSRRVESGIFTDKGAWGNLLAGEAYTAPLEGTGEGTIVVEKGWHPRLKENMRLIFAGGAVAEVQGGGTVGNELRELLKLGIGEEPYKSRRNLAEFGIGTNPNARRPDNILEAEKISGTIHLAVGDKVHMGGEVNADLHQDFILPKPDVFIDDRPVMRKGKVT